MSTIETVKPKNQQLEKALVNLIQGIKKEPNQANAVFKAKSSLEDGFLAEVKIRDFNFQSDEPEELGGTNLGPNPVEYVLGAFAACQEIVIQAYATVLGIDVVSVHVDVEGDVDLHGFLNLSDARAGFTDVRYKTVIETNETDQDKLKQLEHFSVRRCPVLDIIRNPVPLEGSVSFKKTGVNPDGLKS
ncbi:OsmC family peroxiredoxin [Rhodohalobacter sp. SW132]|uniref:OsmC family protein n=1 Tax=Rhodohalobacter sp. SW132 TaxID=2293433 RepID=UPI000E24B99F|nr:OsmC family protein [Rhodohalobacter sp. SW132]REL38107.1 OsmC family peroxiredoxin [Rhodohalobacter sp. SW132]